MKTKKMKIAINLVVISIIGVVLLCRCERCVMEELPSQNFTDEELQMVPYLKGDTLLFWCEQTNKTSKYSVIDKISAYEKFSRGNPHDKYSSYCPGDWYYSQYWNFFFDKKQCSISLNILNSFEWNAIVKNVTISFSIPDDTIELKFFGIYKIGIDTLITGTNIVTAYHDTLTLNGICFTNVYELLGSTSLSSQDSDYLKTAYYRKNQGLIGFQAQKGKIWVLK
jgi:hypothetical protein